jgi:hypothetical protein
LKLISLATLMALAGLLIFLSYYMNPVKRFKLAFMVFRLFSAIFSTRPARTPRFPFADSLTWLQGQSQGAVVALQPLFAGRAPRFADRPPWLASDAACRGAA